MTIKKFYNLFFSHSIFQLLNFNPRMRNNFASIIVSLPGVEYIYIFDLPDSIQPIKTITHKHTNFSIFTISKSNISFTIFCISQLTGLFYLKYSLFSWFFLHILMIWVYNINWTISYEEKVWASRKSFNVRARCVFLRL